MLKKLLYRWMLARWDYLTDLDRRLAYRMFKSLQGFTISGHAYLLQRRSLWGRLLAWKIDLFFRWLRGEQHHCRNAFVNDLLRIA